MQAIVEWEQEHGKEYPRWACVWMYDAYGECWTTGTWREFVDYYADERKKAEGKAMWKHDFEPMVANATDTVPEWGDGTPLKRDIA